MSGRTAKRLRSYLRALPQELRVPGIVSRLRRGWASLTSRERGVVGALSERRGTEAAMRVRGAAPAYFPATVSHGKKGGTGLLPSRPRTGGPAKHPRRRWAHDRREARRLARLAGGGR